MALSSNFHHFAAIDNDGCVRHYHYGSSSEYFHCSFQKGIIDIPSCIVNISDGVSGPNFGRKSSYMERAIQDRAEI